MSDFYKEVKKVQQQLKANKGQFNKFGGYAYRSCEDILEAFKKVETDLVLTITDDIVQVGDRIYIKATATLTDGKESICTTAFAREAASRKGMDDSQISGSASTYSRKYACCGLLLIDDNKDADSNEQHNITSGKKADCELYEVMADGDEFAIAEYWRGMNQQEQTRQWNMIDKESQKALKEILSRVNKG